MHIPWQLREEKYVPSFYYTYKLPTFAERFTCSLILKEKIFVVFFRFLFLLKYS